MVAELDRTAAKAAGIDADFTFLAGDHAPAIAAGRGRRQRGGAEEPIDGFPGRARPAERGALRIFSEPTVAVVSGRPAKVVVGNQPPDSATPGLGGSRPNPNNVPMRPTTLSLVATLLTGDRIRLEVTPAAEVARPWHGARPHGTVSTGDGIRRASRWADVGRLRLDRRPQEAAAGEPQHNAHFWAVVLQARSTAAQSDGDADPGDGRSPQPGRRRTRRPAVGRKRHGKTRRDDGRSLTGTTWVLPNKTGKYPVGNALRGVPGGGVAASMAIHGTPRGAFPTDHDPAECRKGPESLVASPHPDPIPEGEGETIAASRCSRSPCPQRNSSPIFRAQTGTSPRRSASILRGPCGCRPGPLLRVPCPGGQRRQVAPRVSVMIGKLPKGDRPAAAAFQRVAKAGRVADARKGGDPPARQPADRLLATLVGDQRERGMDDLAPGGVGGIPGGPAGEANLEVRRRSGPPGTAAPRRHGQGRRPAREASRGERRDGSPAAPRRPGARGPDRGPNGDAGRRRPARSPGNGTARSPRGPPPHGRDSACGRPGASRPAAPGLRRSRFPAGRRTPG